MRRLDRAICAAVALVLHGSALAADARHPTVVELFTAQGCAACPPAQAAVNALASRADVIALTFAVTYWNARGWRDRFAKPAFTERQRRYSLIGQREMATPQVILNGRFAIVGNDPTALARAITTADRGDEGPAIVARGATLRIAADAATARPSTVWLVRYDPRTIAVPIGAGQNAGRTLPHRNVVRTLERIGAWRGSARSFPLPAAQPPLRRAILVQSADGGAIIAAARID